MKELVKLVVFVPESHTQIVREAMGQAGAGKIGNYSFCSFSTKGTGRFKPEQGAHPAIGKVGELEEALEERIEVACEKNKVKQVIEAIKKAHPCEEVVIDIYPMIVLDNE